MLALSAPSSYLSRLKPAILTLCACIFLALQATYAQETSIIRIGVASGPATLDSQIELSDFNLHQDIFDNLVRRSADGLLVPGLATSWQYLPEETAWLFELREGVQFHNGDAFTARDVKFSIDRMLELGEASPEYVKVIRFVREVEIVDDFTVKLHMHDPDPLWVTNLSLVPTIFPQDYFEQVGVDEFGRNPVGTGPYRVVRFDQGRELVLTAFAEHWAGEPPIRDVVFRFIPDESTRVAELIAGGIDLMPGIPAERQGEIERQPNLTVFSRESTVNLYLGFNAAVEPFDDVRVREAVARAIPVDQIREALFGLFATRARTAVQKTSFGHDASLEPHDYDPDAARALLAEAGHPAGVQTVIDVAPLAQWPRNVQVAEAIAGALAEVGIRVSVQRSEFADYFERFRAGSLNGMFIWGNTAATFDAFRHLNLNFHGGTGRQGIYWNDPQVDAWIEEAGRTTDDATRLELYASVQRMIHDEVAIVPLIEYTNAYGMSTAFVWDGRRDAYIKPSEIRPAGSQ